MDDYGSLNALLVGHNLISDLFGVLICMFGNRKQIKIMERLAKKDPNKCRNKFGEDGPSHTGVIATLNKISITRRSKFFKHIFGDYFIPNAHPHRGPYLYIRHVSAISAFR